MGSPNEGVRIGTRGASVTLEMQWSSEREVLAPDSWTSKKGWRLQRECAVKRLQQTCHDVPRAK